MLAPLLLMHCLSKGWPLPPKIFRCWRSTQEARELLTFVPHDSALFGRGGETSFHSEDITGSPEKEATGAIAVAIAPV